MTIEELEADIKAAVRRYWETNPPEEKANLGIEVDSDAWSTSDRGLIVQTEVLAFPEEEE
jgi:hypothetical protein